MESASSFGSGTEPMFKGLASAGKCTQGDKAGRAGAA